MVVTTEITAAMTNRTHQNRRQRRRSLPRRPSLQKNPSLQKRPSLQKNPSLQRRPSPLRSRDRRANQKASQSLKRSLNQEAVKNRRKTDKSSIIYEAHFTEEILERLFHFLLLFIKKLTYLK